MSDATRETAKSSVVYEIGKGKQRYFTFPLKRINLVYFKNYKIYARLNLSMAIR